MDRGGDYMKSVKPGRAPSFMGSVGSIIIGVIGIGWTIGANQMGAPGFFTLFGVGFVTLAVVGAVYQLKNATSKNRFSAFDITDGSEETDPLNARFGARNESPAPSADSGAAFCPYCGAKAEDGYLYFKKCGKKLPG
jgi:hypothetical protein